MIRLLIVFFLSLYCMIFAVEFSVPYRPYDLDIADIDQDGYKDIIIASQDIDEPDMFTILENNGIGEFTLHLIPLENGGCIKVSDLDGDLLPDLFTIIPSNSTIIPVYYKNLGDFQFDEATIIPIEYTHVFQQFQLADFENDGDIDIALNRCGSANECHILINDGEGNFEEQFAFLSDSGFTFFSIGDVNQDNFIDILITSSSDPYLYYNYDFDFTPIQIGNMYWDHSWLIDMNQDQLIDIVFDSDIPSYTQLYFNNGTGEFNDSQDIDMSNHSIIIDLGDYNDDGYPDFATQIGYNPYVYICFNDTNNAISEPIMYQFGSVYSFYVKSEDLDGNESIDLVVAGYHDTEGRYSVSILFNDGSGNFLENPQVDAQDEIIFPELIQLYNYPNPFDLSGSSRRKGMTILYQIPLKFNITSMFIYNVKGQIIKKLNIDTNTTKGEIFWNGTNQYNEFVPTGVYFYGVSSCDLTKYNKMLLIN